MSLDEYFATGPPHERPVFDVVNAHLETLGPLHVEPLSVGIYFKRARTFATLQPMRRWVALGFLLPRVETSPRIARKVVPTGSAHWHVVNLAAAGEFDDTVRGWLTESYLAAPPA